ncbi:hypothetical protein V5799_003378 [Amblyomma americanum]|uniref:Uncharacterized protein n=1 Tax=Amblyomma americanum TaxID=6943 RepID=A0AAQ4D954_AMBAM
MNALDLAVEEPGALWGHNAAQNYGCSDAEEAFAQAGEWSVIDKPVEEVAVMQADEIEILVDCSKAHPEMPQKVIDHWNAQIALFTGMGDAEVVLLVCKTSLDAGEALYNEFSTSHLEHKKTIDMIAEHCYEIATGQKVA